MSQYLKQLTSSRYHLVDHAGGFDQHLINSSIELIPNLDIELITEYVISSEIQSRYPHIRFKFNDTFKKTLFGLLSNYNTHPELKFQNFVCSFNGSDHVGRKLLVSILHRFKWFDPQYSSKNFLFSTDIIDGHISDYTEDSFYRTFFISDNSEEFFQKKYSFGHNRYNHDKNIYNLEHKLTESFLHLVSETMATSYYPFVTEKFLYSVVTRGLFLAYAQPGWHSHVEKYYGFKRYTKLFDYRFDTIENPVERLVELMSMISKFSVLSKDDWRDLYLLEQDTIEYNYNHYFSGEYLEFLTPHE